MAPARVEDSLIQGVYLDIHDGFQNHRIGGLERLSEGIDTGHFESHFTTVHVMCCAIYQSNAHALYKTSVSVECHHTDRPLILC